MDFRKDFDVTRSIITIDIIVWLTFAAACSALHAPPPRVRIKLISSFASVSWDSNEMIWLRLEESSRSTSATHAASLPHKLKYKKNKIHRWFKLPTKRKSQCAISLFFWCNLFSSFYFIIFFVHVVNFSFRFFFTHLSGLQICHFSCNLNRCFDPMFVNIVLLLFLLSLLLLLLFVLNSIPCSKSSFVT